MIFLSLVVVLAIVYWLGSASFIHYDGWFKWLINRLQKIPGFSASPIPPLLLALLIPLVALIFIFLLINEFAGKHWLFFLYVPVLLYSLGRGNILVDAREYIALATRGDGVAAAQLIDRLRGNTPADHNSAEVSDWRELHTEALKVIAYRGFERSFAVLFWFFIAGPFGALLYRLSVLYRDFSPLESDAFGTASKWLWLLELPAVRLMGVTWAFVGNFETCPLRKNLLDTQSPSDYVLNECLRGALGAPTDCSTAAMAQMNSEEKAEMEEEMAEETQDIIEDLTGDVITTHTEPAYSFALVKSSLPLYSRSLLFWICAIAFATLVV
ncbi:regulatory signaling modulator protein AmpE [Cellvibrio sp. KY-YJ-3]|uniref:regulatory signaling modulator protein AmpE n=1 Tax=Cellvibrio sp. KY-YJ-3 TaxID=454662 RepID=UPI001248B42D|nr:regulatory signaling modulator protein AmpE [Cellvibrio sp. KY-YJ-3]QEY13813.1 transcriptional regulator [Cellvibrio sp. KY-YJ-3]